MKKDHGCEEHHEIGQAHEGIKERERVMNECLLPDHCLKNKTEKREDIKHIRQVHHHRDILEG